MALFRAPPRWVCRHVASAWLAGENVHIACTGGRLAGDDTALSDSNPTTRLDKWLWAARFYKTRQLAAEAVKGGHVDVNGTRAKPARGIRVGDRIEVHKTPFDFSIEVLDLRERRVSAREAQGMYEESRESIEKREQRRITLRSQAQQILYDSRKPDKRDRRQARGRKRGE